MLASSSDTSCVRELNVWPHVGGTSGHLTAFFSIHPNVLAASCRQLENLLLKREREVSVGWIVTGNMVGFFQVAAKLPLEHHFPDTQSSSFITQDTVYSEWNIKNAFSKILNPCRRFQLQIKLQNGTQRNKHVNIDYLMSEIMPHD